MAPLFRVDCVIVLPSRVFSRHANCAWPVTSSNGRGFIEKEHAIFHVATAHDGLHRRTAIEATIEFSPAMASERSGYGTGVWLAVRTGQREGLIQNGHRFGTLSTLPAN